ncbi:hypothetical protein J6590_046941 [Homalodisca vitripennis]|nr:hypothetical protein J6590_046941 [Homalodisca vitripennis]
MHKVGEVRGMSRLLSRSMRKNLGHYISVMLRWKKGRPALYKPLQSKQAEGGWNHPEVISSRRSRVPNDSNLQKQSAPDAEISPKSHQYARDIKFEFDASYRPGGSILKYSSPDFLEADIQKE